MGENKSGLSTGMRSMRRALALVLILGAGLFLVSRLARFSDTSACIETDLAQLYLMGKAVQHGQTPYAPIPEQAKQSFGVSSFRNPHPAPYPPTVAVLFAPLAHLDIRLLCIAWLLLSYCAAYAVLRAGPGHKRSTGLNVAFAAALIISASGSSDLTHLQFGFFFLFAYVAAWRCIQQGREISAALWLSLPTIIKGFGWPLLLLLVIRRRYRACLTYCAAGLAACLASLAVLGPEAWKEYLARALPQAVEYWRDAFQNLALSSLPARLAQPPAVLTLVDGGFAHVHRASAGSSVYSLCGYAAVGIVLALLALGARRCPSEERALAAFVTAQPFLGPIAWGHYFVTFAFALMLLDETGELRQTKALRRAAGLLALMMLVDFPALTFRLFSAGLSAGIVHEAPVWAVFMASLPCLISIGCAAAVLLPRRSAQAT